MKIKILGTAAAEGWPGVFCCCEACRQAAALGGKNIRTRSQLLVNDDLLVDLPPDTYFHKTVHGLDLSRVGTLLVTHSHMDHFHPMELSMRGGCFAHDMARSNLDVYCNARVTERYRLAADFEPFAPEVADALHLHVVEPFMHFTSGGYEIWTLKAEHARARGEKAVFYLIKDGDRAFMQCNDTGYLPDEDFAYLESLGIKLDAILLESTGGLTKYGLGGTHMAMLDAVEMVERMRESHFTHAGTQYAVTHFSHNAGFLHAAYEDFFTPHGIAVAYDGMEISL